MKNGSIRSATTMCEEHPGYLATLTEADGAGLPLPEAPRGCPTCAANLGQFRAATDVLRWRETAEPNPLEENWQESVWLKIAETGTSGSGTDVNIVPFPQTNPLAVAPDDQGEPATATSHPPQRPAKVRSATGSRWNHIWWSIAACLLAVGLAAAMIAYDEPTHDHPATAMKQGKANPQPAGARSANVELLARNTDNRRPSALRTGSRVEKGDRISFDYLNAPSSVGEAMEYLTVVAVQGAAKRNEDDNDKELVLLVDSRPIAATGTSSPQQIDSDIQIDAPTGDMTIYGVFSHQPLHPKAIENAVLRHRDLPGAHFSQLDLKVH